VKTSFFPNWDVSGADGPWRATPNFMVVVPTNKDVVLEYGTTSAEWFGRAGTVVGVIGVAALAWWWRPGRRPEEALEPGEEDEENEEDVDAGGNEGLGAPAVR
jgi:hypothetical protein